MTAQPDFPVHVFAAGAPLVGCVDIGGTKVAVSVADERGMRGRVSEATVKQGARDALGRQVLGLLARSCEAAGVAVGALTSVGVSSCGPFVLKEGLIELAAPNICGGMAGTARGLPNDWTSVPLEAPLRAALRNVRIENDCVAALEAERCWGALQGCAHCAYVTWSTGIGVGLCVDGRVLHGKHGNAGHAGHMFVSDNADALCGCGNIGDLESLVAGNAIERRFPVQGYADAASLLIAARAHEQGAVALVDELCRVMGRALYNLVVTLDLQRISLGGSVFWHHRDYLLPRLQAQLDGKLPALTAGVTLVAAGLQDQVGDYAALALTR
ncbi:MAG: sugar kinase [Polaromonas sp.]|nr:sugar kinase [Polaromonas sp.]